MKKILAIIFVTIGVASCKVTQPSSQSPIEPLQIAFIQINDVYEIEPINNGKQGGMARLAYLKDSIRSIYPNTFMILAGDFVSPSIYNSLKIDGSLVRGKQMVEALSAAGLDLATFGNHEFDIKLNELQQRIDESTFEWISGNAFMNQLNIVTPFQQRGKPLAETKIMSFPYGSDSVRIGIINTCLPFNKSNYVVYFDPISTLEKHYQQIAPQCDIVIAITHQTMQDDEILAQRLPKLKVIMGGHEHDMRYKQVGDVWITKAHANAASAFIHHFNIKKDKNSVECDLKIDLVYLDEKLGFQPKTAAVVKKWTDKAEANFSSMGFQTKEVLIASGDSLEGRESYVRTTSTNLTQTVVKAMEKACPEADFAIVNSGSIRVDDVLRMPLTTYDILRTLPYGGAVVEVEMKGKLVKQLLEVSLHNRGSGGFLQYSTSLEWKGQELWFNDKPIEPETYYRVATSDFMISGGEANMGFFTPENPDVKKVHPVVTELGHPKSDIRHATIHYLKSLK